MRIAALVIFLTSSICWAQAPAPAPEPASPAQTPAPTSAQLQTVTIPTGTRIPLALASPITTKSRPGNAVRAVTGFPVTVGTQLAIPVGAYVEGVLDRINKGGRSGPGVQMHFTRILYANGYSVTVNGASMQAEYRNPKAGAPELSAYAGETGNSLAAGSSPQLPAMQPLPSHTGAMVGLAVGGAAAAIAIVVLGRYHRGNAGMLFDTGWQFEMLLESPLSIDTASLPTAGASSRPQ